MTGMSNRKEIPPEFRLFCGPESLRIGLIARPDTGFRSFFVHRGVGKDSSVGFSLETPPEFPSE